MDLIKSATGNRVDDTLPTQFKPDIHKIMFILYNDRTIIEELKNIFLSECTPDELNEMFKEIFCPVHGRRIIRVNNCKN